MLISFTYVDEMCIWTASLSFSFDKFSWRLSLAVTAYECLRVQYPPEVGRDSTLYYFETIFIHGDPIYSTILTDRTFILKKTNFGLI